MKQKILVVGIIALLLVFLLPVASTGFVARTVLAQGGGIDRTENLDNEGSLLPDATLTLTPYNPPIVIPPSGGIFQYQIDIENKEMYQVRFEIWTSLTLPDGSTMSPADGPFEARIPGGWSISRDDLTQSILPENPPGTYTFKAHIGRFPERILATESFTFEKLASGGWFQQSSGTGKWLFDIHFADANNGWAVGQTNTLLHTSNGGDTWTTQTTPVFVNFWSVFGLNGQKAWAGGSGANLLHTSDGGSTWVPQDTNSSPANDWQGIFFLDENNGWIVGGKPFDFTASRRVIKHTTDGGATWVTQYSMANESPLKAVHFVDANNGWAVGEGSGILHTSDGGANWTRQKTGTIDYFEGVHFIDASTGWAVGRDGTIVHTTNGGATWIVQNLGAEYDLTGINFSDANNGWISGTSQSLSESAIFRTDDGGATWHNQDPGPGLILYNVVFIDANNGWAAGDNGTIIHTDTGGE